ncbi:hypothetical protein NDA11_003751 [Ustilago hordei]|nr:hypothetical protein NDA11_003751 [Ustilago hordei]UTT88672.1 hypothetical protein NDA17_004941 [Ustilago hordei]
MCPQPIHALLRAYSSSPPPGSSVAAVVAVAAFTDPSLGKKATGTNCNPIKLQQGRGEGSAWPSLLLRVSSVLSLKQVLNVQTGWKKERFHLEPSQQPARRHPIANCARKGGKRRLKQLVTITVHQVP